MSPEFKRWLKRPSWHCLNAFANEHGFMVKKYFCDGFDDLVMLFDKDGNQLSVGKKSRLRNIFDIDEAFKILKNKIRYDSTK